MKTGNPKHPAGHAPSGSSTNAPGNWLANNYKILFGLLLVNAAAVSLHILATTVHDVIKGHNASNSAGEGHWGPLAFWLVTSMALGLAVWLHRHHFRDIKVLEYRLSHGNPRRALVCFLSMQDRLKQDSKDGSVSIDSLTLARRNLLDDAKALAGLLRPWPWEQLLRGIAPHEGKLERVVLVGSAPSRGADGSHSKGEACKQFLEGYDALRDKVMLWPNPVDFENIGEVVSTLEDIVSHLDQSKVRRDDICIDFTGGQKTTSVAAAIVTLNKSIVNQYVQTSGTKEAYTYDLVLRSAVDSAH